MNDSRQDAWIEQIVRERLADGQRVASIGRSRLPPVGSYVCDRITVSFPDGQKIELFLKDFVSSRLSKDDPRERCVRELRVYEQLLGSSGMCAPRYYGSMLSERACWLLIEFVDAPVIETVDERNGVAAVQGLARLQRHFLDRADQLHECDYLITHDKAYFRRKADCARRDVAQHAPRHAATLEQALECYIGHLDEMAAASPCLVHGAYIPWHVFVDPDSDPPRVCAVDWELAARGSTLYDLAIFVDDAPAGLRSPLCRAYRAAAERFGVPVPERAAMRTLVECFRLHRIVDWLSRSAEKRFAADKIAALVASAAAAAARIARCQ